MQILTIKKQNQILEKIIQAIFKSWFIDFEFPNQKGSPYRSSKGKMKHSILGEVPEDWQVMTLTDAADVVDCLHAKKPSEQREGKLLLQVFNINNDASIDLSKKYLISESDYVLWTSRIEVKEGDCVITNAGRVGAVAQIPAGMNAAIGRNMTAIRCKPNVISLTYLIQYLLSAYTKNEIYKNKDSGTVFDTLNVRGIIKLKIIVPPLKIVERFDQIVKPLHHLKEIIADQSHTLTTLRDTLMPKLLSGKIQI